MKEIDFYHSRLLVDPKKCLEPRQETEILVEKIALLHKNTPPKKFADICCGCGTIGIPLKMVFKQSEAFFVDISSDALEMLKKNIRLNHVDATFFQGDLLEPLIENNILVDLLVSNPPYVALNEIDLLDSSALKEPPIALFGGKDGLDFYRRLAEDLPKVLTPRANVYFEIGFSQGDAILKIFDRPYYVLKKVENDYSGHNRFFSLVFHPQPLLES